MKWWLADCVEVITLEGEKSVLQRINRCLVMAGSANEAYRRATTLGRGSNFEYLNEMGNRVRCRFAGLADLVPLHDGVEDGAEIEYLERTTRSVAAARSAVRRKRELSVFTPIRPPSALRAKLVPAEIAAELRAKLETGAPSRRGRRSR